MEEEQSVKSYLKETVAPELQKHMQKVKDMIPTRDLEDSVKWKDLDDLFCCSAAIGMMLSCAQVIDEL